MFSFNQNQFEQMHMPEQLSGLQNLHNYQNLQKSHISESDQNYSESNFSTNKEQNLIKEMEYLDCVMKATELESKINFKFNSFMFTGHHNLFIVNYNDDNVPTLSRVEDIQSRIDQWNELTSNLESIKEQMFGETSSTPWRNEIKDEIRKLNRNWHNESLPSLDTDRQNPLESQIDSDYIIDLTGKMKSPEKVEYFPESSFTPIKEDDYENDQISSFPSSFWVDDFEKTDAKLDKAIGQVRDVLHSINL